MSPRYVEFGRACIEKIFAGNRAVLYVAALGEKQFKQANKQFRDLIYKLWDELPSSPPKQRPPEETEPKQEPSLQILAWQNSSPVWPGPLTTRFQEGTVEYQAIMAEKAEFFEKYPENQGAAAKPGPRGRVAACVTMPLTLEHSL